MDDRDYAFDANGVADQNALPNDDELSHHYYCPINMGGACSCPVQDNANNNNNTNNNNNNNNNIKHKKLARANKAARLREEEHLQRFDQSYYYEENLYSDNNNNNNEDSYNDPYSSQLLPPSTPYDNVNGNLTSLSVCIYCQGTFRTNGLMSCERCSSQRNSSYSDYFDPSKKFGPASYGEDEDREGLEEQGAMSHPKIQVTAKILFGTVSAITDLKQKKASKKSK